MSDNAPTPQDDADRIRLKRLAKLQSAASPSSSATATPTASTSAIATPAATSTPVAGISSSGIAAPVLAPKPKPIPRPSALAQTPPPAPRPASGLAKKKAVPKLDLSAWEHETIEGILKVTLNKDVAEKRGYDLVWLKHLAQELQSEGDSNERLNIDLLDRLLIARLELNPQAMSDELDYLPVLVSLPPQQTVFEYLVGCWKRLNSARSAVMKKGYAPADSLQALDQLEKIKQLVISYSGYILQDPEMFPQPSGRELGASELVKPLLSLSALSAPLLSSGSENPYSLTPSDIEQWLQDFARRFEMDNEMDDILQPVVRGLLFHESLFRPEGLGGSDSSWRGVISGLEVLVSIKSIASMITRMEEWNPSNASAATFERVSLLGPLCRLGVFAFEWPGIAQTYFSEPEKRSRQDIESTFASFRGTLKSLQTSLFQVFNTLVRASVETREAVLSYFARVVSLNVKRAGMQVDPTTVASDSFMLNMQAVLLRFCEPFMDASYTKMDRIDPLYYARSTRITLGDETRIKATSEEAHQWEEQHKAPGGPAPNFVSDVFYLTVAMSHYGYLRSIQTYNDLAKHIEELQRHLDMLNGDGSWMNSPLRIRTEAAINHVKKELAKIKGQQLAFEAGLTDPDMTFRSIGFTNFLSTWLIRQVDPKKTHPAPLIELPLPKEVPMAFRVLPEYIVEDIVNYLYFAVQCNPFLKSKINDVLFMSVWGYGRERNGILGNMLNSHPLALKNLMPALMHFYIEVEQTGASSQRSISYILKVVWDNPTHREALNLEAENVDKFVKFVNLMINDVTYLMDESLSELTQIHNIQVEMDDKTTWESKPLEYRRERQGTLRSLERHASGYTTLGRSTVELLKIFTAETKAPFMMPEIVDRLAAMLDYNLQALVGPRYQELKVREPEKLRFNPKVLLADIIQVFLNLSDQTTFITAVAGDGRSYSKELFDRAADIALKRNIKSETEIAKLRVFVEKVEEAKATLEAEDELGDIPDEYLDPLMFSVMKDPVCLPSSRAIVDRSTIKSHLLSDSTDPFNRAPLTIDDVIPVPELKARIEEFLIERRNKNKILETPAIGDADMDTTR
ncbi:ubiquitin elongating factor core-domain-containing protein [Gymnopilus junonius]|uniref:RING-type E3 ubiquitin transferase n=1 Tax=Gymnopilus junonius TaxID=109634 RepID=A0A9P5NSL4_GYMJU|nr:ubiquitin elongating factor core-domain-containing protein [Gymnopilus junonius]